MQEFLEDAPISFVDPKKTTAHSEVLLKHVPDNLFLQTLNSRGIRRYVPVQKFVQLVLQMDFLETYGIFLN